MGFSFAERWREQDSTPNPFSEAVARRRASGLPLFDLTLTNPTQCGLEYPPRWEDALSHPEARVYDPDARGGEAARAAVARYYEARDGETVDARDFVLTAGTSEAYSHLFRLLCAPGDAVLVPRPSYPLLETLAELGGVSLLPYDLIEGDADFARGTPWRLDRAGLKRALRASGDRVRALVVVSPNNPTGSRLHDEDAAHLLEHAAAHGFALIVDEVFADSVRGRASTSIRPRADAADAPLVFTLNGLSKSLALPQLKLAWIRVEGNPRDARRALGLLEWMCDAYLSVSTASQLACAALLPRRAEFLAPLRARIETNLEALRAVAAGQPRLRPLWPEGGWCLPVRCEGVEDDEAFAIRLAEKEGVIAQPGYFFEFDGEDFLVLSLLTEPRVFREGVARLARALAKP